MILQKCTTCWNLASAQSVSLGKAETGGGPRAGSHGISSWNFVHDRMDSLQLGTRASN